MDYLKDLFHSSLQNAGMVRAIAPGILELSGVHLYIEHKQKRGKAWFVSYSCLFCCCCFPIIFILLYVKIKDVYSIFCFSSHAFGVND